MTALAAENSRPRRMLAIFFVSLAGLLLEVGYTRIVSYKLWYYYTYLVIGLALLGIGSGGVLVATPLRLLARAAERLIPLSTIFGARGDVVVYSDFSKRHVLHVSISYYR